MLATVQGEDKQYRVLIVSDSNQQASGKGIYWKDRELSKVIMDAHFSGTNKFDFDGESYSIESVTVHPRYSTEKSKWKKYNSLTETKELYVFRQKGIYDDPEKGYELVDTKLYFPQISQAIKVTVYYEAEDLVDPDAVAFSIEFKVNNISLAEEVLLEAIMEMPVMGGGEADKKRNVDRVDRVGFHFRRSHLVSDCEQRQHIEPLILSLVP
jgi:hypothetical protein